MEEKVGYAGEAPSLPSWAETDWRLQEMLSMGPQAVMDELLGLSEEIHDSRLLHEETKFELRQAQERLKLMEAQVLQAALDSEDKDISDQVKGKNAEERKRQADIYLADHPTVKQLAFEIKPLESLEAAARVETETLLERSKNLHQWARMFEAQVRLLSTVRMPEPAGMRAQLLYFVGEGSTPPLMVGVKSEGHAERIRQQAVEGGYTEVAEAAYVHAMEVYRRSQEPVLEGDVLAAMTAGGVEVPVETSYVGEEPEPDGARFASEVDELFSPEVEILPSMDMSEAEVDDVKAAIKRYQVAGEKVDESSGPSL